MLNSCCPRHWSVDINTCQRRGEATLQLRPARRICFQNNGRFSWSRGAGCYVSFVIALVVLGYSDPNTTPYQRYARLALLERSDEHKIKIALVRTRLVPVSRENTFENPHRTHYEGRFSSCGRSWRTCLE